MLSKKFVFGSFELCKPSELGKSESGLGKPKAAASMLTTSGKSKGREASSAAVNEFLPFDILGLSHMSCNAVRLIFAPKNYLPQ